jgi:hypothetical protein
LLRDECPPEKSVFEKLQENNMFKDLIGETKERKLLKVTLKNKTENEVR